MGTGDSDRLGVDRKVIMSTVFTASRLFAAIALVFFIIATLTAAGDVTGFAWALPAGLASLALMFLV
jgi:hypothetical protein